MSITLRTLLIMCSLINFIFIIRQIKKSKLKIEDSILWIIVSLILIIMSVFSGLVNFISIRLGFAASSNFVFVIVIAFLIFEIFFQNIKISVLNEKIKNINHYIALNNKGED